MELVLSETEFSTGGQTGQAAWISKGLKVEETQYVIQWIIIDLEAEITSKICTPVSYLQIAAVPDYCPETWSGKAAQNPYNSNYIFYQGS